MDIVYRNGGGYKFHCVYRNTIASYPNRRENVLEKVMSNVFKMSIALAL